MTADCSPVGEVIIGIDTHAEQHTAAAINGIGQILATIEIPTTPAGYRQLVRWARGLGRFQRAGVEGCGAYGAGLARHLSAEGIVVIEVDRPNRQRRRRRGKSDTTDAESAARAVLAGDATGLAKDTTGTVETIRILHLTRRSAVKAKTQAGNQIKDLVLTAPEPVRGTLRAKTTRQRVRTCAAWRPGSVTDPATGSRRALHDLARRWLALHAEIKALEADLTRLLRELVPSLWTERGVGLDVAAKLVIAAGENPERLRHEASFAALCGASPTDASSGNTLRIDSTEAGTDKPTTPCTPSCSTAGAPARRLAPTSPVAAAKARPTAPSAAASSALSPAASTGSSSTTCSR
jgi:transposase